MIRKRGRLRSYFCRPRCPRRVLAFPTTNERHAHSLSSWNGHCIQQIISKRSRSPYTSWKDCCVLDCPRGEEILGWSFRCDELPRWPTGCNCIGQVVYSQQIISTWSYLLVIQPQSLGVGLSFSRYHKFNPRDGTCHLMWQKMIFYWIFGYKSFDVYTIQYGWVLDRIDLGDVFQVFLFCLEYIIDTILLFTYLQVTGLSCLQKGGANWCEELEYVFVVNYEVH